MAISFRVFRKFRGSILSRDRHPVHSMLRGRAVSARGHQHGRNFEMGRHKVVCPGEIVCCGQPSFAQILRSQAFHETEAKEGHSGNQPNWRQPERPNILSFLSLFGSRRTYKIDALNKFSRLARHFTEKNAVKTAGKKFAFLLQLILSGAVNMIV